MKPRDFKNLFMSGLILGGLGVYGLMMYAIRNKSFKDAIRQWANKNPDKVKEIRSNLQSEEGISDAGTDSA